MFSTYITKSPEETIELGEKLAHRLNGGDTVLLFGDLGTGKTHFTKGIAKGLEINEIIKSPTFAYVKQYQIKSITTVPQLPHNCPTTEMYHYDLYRLSKGDDTSSIGLEESIENNKVINVVEWADRMTELPDKYIAVTFEIENENRKINIEFIDPEIVPIEKINEFYEEWTTPIHIRKHCKAVTNIADKIGSAFARKGEIINANLIHSAGMLHDIARVCDFHDLEHSGFEEEVTDKKIEIWNRQIADFKDEKHEEIAYNFFMKKGYTKTAETIRLHRGLSIVEEPEAYDIPEKKIIFYADKRAKHYEIVDIKERFRDGKVRNGKNNDEKERLMYDIIFQQTLELEKNLFDGLDIEPGEL